MSESWPGHDSISCSKGRLVQDRAWVKSCQVYQVHARPSCISGDNIQLLDLYSHLIKEKAT